MRKINVLLIIFIFISVSFLHNTLAQEYNRWDLPEHAKMRIGKGSVGTLTFSPDGKRLIVKSSIGLWVYDTHTGTELDFVPGDQSNILGLSPNANIYVSRDTDNTVSVRNITDGSVISTLQGETTDIKHTIVSHDEDIIVSKIGNEILAWDLGTGSIKRSIKLEVEWISDVALSPDGTTIASRSWNPDSYHLELWDVATGTLIRTLSRYARYMDDVLFTPDGKTIITSGETSVQLWDVSAGKRTINFSTPRHNSIAVSPNGETIATVGQKGLHLWDLATGEYIKHLGQHLWGIYNVAFSPDGTTLASSGRDELYLWDVESGTRKMSVKGHTSAIGGVAISPDGSVLATSNWPHINLWNPITGEHKHFIYGRGHHSYHFDLVYSPDGNILVSLDFSTIHLWDAFTNEHLAAIYTWRGHGQIPTQRITQQFNSFVFSPDGNHLVAGHTDHTIHIWYMGRTYIDALKGHTDVVSSIAFSPDNQTLISGSYDQTVRIWDFTARSNIATFTGHTDKINSVAVNPDGSKIASGSEDNIIILWEVATGNSITIHTQHTHGIEQLTFSIDGKTRVSCGAYEDPIIQIWDVANANLITNITDHSKGRPRVVFNPDGKTLFSTSYDGTVLLWDYAALLGGDDSEIQIFAEDANRDGSVDLQDLIYVASQFGKTGLDSPADVNADGVINIADLLLVAAALTDGNSAPSIDTGTNDSISAAEIQQWLDQAWQVNTSQPIYQNGIIVLQGLLARLTPEKTMLLSNYPNPFNPDTWIPYQLAKPADVTLRIYASDGLLIRTLVLGKKPAGRYQIRNDAVYWDGKNEFGEHAASGVYFYTLTAGNFSATRRMVVCK